MKSVPVIQNPTATPVTTQTSGETYRLESDPSTTELLKPKIVQALSNVYDPEIPVNIYELGLIYDIIVDNQHVVGVRMTLTAPACPAAQTLPLEVARRVREIAEVRDVKVDIVWDPPWTRERMSDAAKLQLGMF